MKIHSKFNKRKKSFKYQRYQEFSKSTLEWLATHNGYAKLPYKISYLHQKIFLVIKTRGVKEAIRFVKQIRSDLFRFLSLNSDLDISKNSSIVYIPKSLKPYLYREDLGVPYFRLLLSTLYISRSFKTEAQVNFSSITGPSEIRRIPFIDEDYIEFWSDLGYKNSRKPKGKLDFKRYHVSSKAGPNGQALWTSMADLITINSEYPELLEDIKTLGGKKLSKFIELIIKYESSLKEIFSSSVGVIRKLIAFSDKEGKTREVAIFDYFSQTSLLPLHTYLFKALKKIPQDYTFNQNEYQNTLKDSEIYYSVDLTAFTDRFPVSVNYNLIKPRIGLERADSWLRIMTQSFTSPIGEILYSVGNPMGAYSSWNSTTLSHHFVVWKACKNINLDWKTAPYAMLGDDLVIGHKKLALEYCRLIRLMGVHWSKEKTHVSMHFFEFAKQINWCNENISPFPISGLWSERNHVCGQIQILDNAIEKSWFGLDTVLESLDEYFSRIFKLPRRVRTQKESLMRRIWTIMSVLQGRKPALELIPFVEVISPLVAERLDEEKIKNILVNAVMLSFVDSSASLVDKKKHKDTLGQMAEDIVMSLFTIPVAEGDFQDLDNLPSSLPHTFVWGVISENYIDVTRRAYVIDTIERGNWDPLLRNLKIPISDQAVYLRRKTELLYSHSATILKTFEDSIEQLKHYPQLI